LEKQIEILKAAFVALLVLLLLLYFRGDKKEKITSWEQQDRWLQKQYDKTQSNKKVKTKDAIDEILDDLEQRSYDELGAAYLSETESDLPEFEKMLKDGTYYVITNGDQYRRIVYNFRIKDFMPKDEYYQASLGEEDREILWLINKEVLYKLLELQQRLEDEDFDPYAITVNSVFRYPKYNKKIGGSSRSTHIKGEAIDISVLDINSDGEADEVDKKIVLDFLEKDIIANKGGIGRYPKTQTIHFDVRGKRARWNSF